MIFSHDGQNYTLRLSRGEYVVEQLKTFVREHNIRGGWVSGIGGLTAAELGFYNLDAKAYEWQVFDEPLELTNLTGNIAWNKDQPILHLHATVADSTFKSGGGHLKEAEVGGTVEILMVVWRNDKGFGRTGDSDTGLNLLSL